LICKSGGIASTKTEAGIYGPSGQTLPPRKRGLVPVKTGTGE